MKWSVRWSCWKVFIFSIYSKQLEEEKVVHLKCKKLLLFNVEYNAIIVNKFIFPTSGSESDPQKIYIHIMELCTNFCNLQCIEIKIILLFHIKFGQQTLKQTFRGILDPDVQTKAGFRTKPLDKPDPNLSFFGTWIRRKCPDPKLTH